MLSVQTLSSPRDRKAQAPVEESEGRRGSRLAFAGTRVGGQQGVRGARGATGAAGRSAGRSYCLPGLRFLPAALEVAMGSLSRQVGSALAAAGGPGMCEGRDDSDCRRPLCATPSLYIYRALSCAPPGCLLQSLTCEGSAGEYTATAAALPAASALKDLH